MGARKKNKNISDKLIFKCFCMWLLSQQQQNQQQFIYNIFSIWIKFAILLHENLKHIIVQV